jgi:hypothetical protein
LVCGPTIQTAGFGPSAIKAVHGTDICAPGCRLAVPATALPSVIVAGGFWIAILTRTVALFASMAGDTSLT